MRPRAYRFTVAAFLFLSFGQQAEVFADRVYWADHLAKVIWRADLNSGYKEMLYGVGQDDPIDVALDLVNGKL